ncbi:hypothetical protein PoB_001961600 [Plakobranchus ocellatus]|uniref:SMB domain-containing protein n=1 Tax=Plakobranchus ocellatus TaxID=259542 RepID=A0AAV3Z1C3_9GAST|nr:hypothetical protein PoB_001961600 [Plakobranchus ocellatus]
MSLAVHQYELSAVLRPFAAQPWRKEPPKAVSYDRTRGDVDQEVHARVDIQYQNVDATDHQEYVPEETNGEKKKDYFETNVSHLQRGSASRYLQLSTSTARVSPDASTEQFTIPYRNEDSECQRIAFDYVYRENICGAPDPDTYMEAAKARYTCKDRCGDVPVYGKDLFDCACDETCIAHRDCCKDLSVACPTVYASGKIKYSHFIGSTAPSCSADDYNILYFFTPQWYAQTTPIARNTPKKLPEKKTNQELNMVGSLLLKDVFNSFRLADLSLNVVSEGFDSFKLFAKSSSIPKFVPRVATLVCPYASSKDFRNAADVFESCLVTDITDVVTPLHRNCKMHQIISCHCNSSVKYNQHVHNVCMGQNLSPLTQHTLWNYQLQFEYKIGHAGQCKIFNRTQTGSYNPRVGMEREKNGNSFSITAFPMFTEFVDRSQGNSSENRGRLGDYELEGISQVTTWEIAEKGDIYYIVTLENMLEKRLRCPSLDIMVKECRLEECVHGAIMSNTENLFNYFGNRSCVIPVLATALQGDSHMTVPLCSCLRVMSALSALQIWRIKLGLTEERMCSFHLALLSTESTTAQPNQFPTREAPKPDTETRFQDLYKASNMSCSNEVATDKTLQICFYTAEEATKTEPKPAVDRSTHAASTVDFTIPYRDEDSECQQIAFDYVYRENICGAPDPDTYMETAKARYACKDRCGDVPVYGKDLFDCACDESCIVHGDCCKDLSVACPDIYASGKIQYSQLIGSAAPLCSNNDYNVLFFFTRQWYTQTTPTARNTPKKVPEKNTNQELKMVGSLLLKDVFHFFRLADLSLNVVSESYDHFKLFAKSSSIPKFVPRVATLVCPYAFSKDFRNAADVFESCLVTDITDVVTPLHRNCKMHQIISCHCNSSVKYNQHVHNVCMGQKLSPITQHTLWNYQLQFEQKIGHGSQCKIFNRTETGSYNPRVATERKKKENSFSITVFPIFTGFGDWSQANSNKNRSRVDDHQLEGSSQVTTWEIAEKGDIYYIVTLENVLEKRLRCPSLDIMLKECTLEECVHGAIMSNTENSFNYFGNRSCVMPVLATASQGDSHMTVPLCSCLRVMSALSALQMWRIKLRLTGESMCSFHLALLSTEPTTGQANQFFTREPPKPDTGTKFQDLYKASSINCSNEVAADKTLQICFYTAEEATKTEPKPANSVSIIRYKLYITGVTSG